MAKNLITRRDYRTIECVQKRSAEHEEVFLLVICSANDGDDIR